MLNILIPIDFSTTSYNAMKYALAFQREFKFSITCMNAYAENKPKKSVKKFRESFGHDFDLELIKGGLFSAYKSYTRKNKTNLVIMGTKGVQGLKKLFKGSNASNLMLQTDIPVLIVPEESKYETINKIMWASDFKPMVNPDALNLLKDIAISTESTVRIAHVKTSDKKSELEKREEKRWEDSFFGKEVRHSFKKIRRSSVSKGIKFYLKKKEDNNLLVLIRREYGFMDKLFRKNHAAEFAQSPMLPIMIIHE